MAFQYYGGYAPQQQQPQYAQQQPQQQQQQPSLDLGGLSSLFGEGGLFGGGGGGGAAAGGGGAAAASMGGGSAGAGMTPSGAGFTSITGGGAAAGGSAAGGSGSAAGGGSALGSAGPWGLLAAVIVGNELAANDEGRRPDSGWAWFRELLTGEVTERDMDYYGDKVGGVGGEVIEVAGKMSNPFSTFGWLEDM